MMRDISVSLLSRIFYDEVFLSCRVSQTINSIDGTPLADFFALSEHVFSQMKSSASKKDQRGPSRDPVMSFAGR